MSAPDSIDADNPWLGLASFTEETRALFFGREGEVAELGRRVQRKLLTVLFGKSGLGKTSILQAGLVPGLRERGYFPVYLRIDYGHDSPEPAEQIKQAIGKAAASGGWTQSDVAVAGESIWEFLHHRDDVLKDASGATLIPLLIFDQFEELFTLAQSDEFGRARAARFVEELADLVENRPPKALEAKLEADESTAERFDFSRSDYRVVIALREDYLAPLESLKRQMPTLSQNRLRLAPMTGSQALAAVLQPGNRLRPGKPLVSEEVAEAIVRFVAGGAELANAEVEPSLLSLICRELNEQRIAQGRGEISQDLLAGSHETILSTFYERALADQPEPVRRIIEDDLLTESGYRENLAEESLLRRFQAAGAAPDALAKLVNRRLLRIEERLDVRRVELTHDVLTGVVKASRDQRHEREAREATERMLAEQQAREHAARRALQRARTVAAGCTLLALVAIAAAIFAVLSVQRARRAELVARQTRAISEQARQEAEGLLGFLTDDFVRELETFGREQTIAELSQREIDYFHHLPASLEDPQTVRAGALALVNHAHALDDLGDPGTAAKNATEAIAMLEQQRRDGDRSDATTIVLGRAYTELGNIVALQNDPKGSIDLAHAADLLRPMADRTDSTIEARRAYVDVLDEIGWRDQNSNQDEDAVRVTREAMRIATEPGARRQGDVELEAGYAGAGAWLGSALVQLGRNGDARRIGEEALAVANRVLAQRPQFGRALGAKQTLEGELAFVARNELDPAEAIGFAMQETQASLARLELEPKNTAYVNNLGAAYTGVGRSMWRVGRLRESIRYDRKAVDAFEQASAGGGFALVNWAGSIVSTASEQALVGDTAGMSATLGGADALTSKLHELGLTGSFTEIFINAIRNVPAATLAYERDDFSTARRLTRNALAQLQAGRPSGAFQIQLMNRAVSAIAPLEGRAEYRLGDFARAAEAERTALQEEVKAGAERMVVGQRGVAAVAIWLSMALAREGKRAEAARTIGPVVTMYRALEKKNHGDQLLPLESAEALYAQSLVDDRHRPALLREAAQRVDHLIPAIARLHDTRAWRARIEAAQRRASEIRPDSGEVAASAPRRRAP